MKKVQVTDNFVKYSFELAQDILGYSECFGSDKEVKRKLRKHIKKCKDILETIEKDK